MNKELIKETLLKILHVVLVGAIVVFFLYPVFGWNLVRYPLALLLTFIVFWGIYKIAIWLGLEKKTDYNDL